MVDAGRAPLFRSADRQGRNDHVERETLAETLVEQSKLCFISGLRSADPAHSDCGAVVERSPVEEPVQPGMAIAEGVIVDAAGGVEALAV